MRSLGLTGMVVLGSLCLAAGAPALAQDAPAQGEALRYYQSGRDHFLAGRYREAVVDLERALALDPGSPTLSYNLARVNELLGDIERALHYYEQYAASLAPSERAERERVEETIRRLEGARTQVRPAEVTPPAVPPDDFELNQPVLVEERGVADAAFWITVGVGGALLAAGAATGIYALTENAALEDYVLGIANTCVMVETCEDAWDARANRVRSFALASDLLLGAGVAAGVTALLLYLLRTRDVVTYPGYAPVEVAATTSSLELRVGGAL
jgi:tetratricopeptide (TPR) repeat protein